MKTILFLSLLCLSSVAVADDKFDATPADLTRVISKETAQFKPVGAKTAGKLEHFAPKTVELKRGYCYVMVMRLGDEATWSAHAKEHGVFFQYKVRKGGDGYDMGGGPGLEGPGAVVSAGCPQKSGTYAFEVGAYGGDEKQRELGSGPYYLQLMAKPNSAKELRKQKAEVDEQEADQKSFVREKVLGGCARCTRNKGDCVEGRRRPLGSDCREDYRLCLERNAISASDCR